MNMLSDTMQQVQSELVVYYTSCSGWPNI